MPLYYYSIEDEHGNKDASIESVLVLSFCIRWARPASCPGCVLVRSDHRAVKADFNEHVAER